MLQVCCAIIEKAGKTLAVQRSSNMSHPLKWEFPGGKILDNETPEECIKREIKEELNIDIVVLTQLEPAFHIYPERSIKLIPFVCKTESEPMLTEHKALRWLSQSELRNIDWLEADIDVVDTYLKS